MQRFIPARAFFEPQALEYASGREIWDRLESMGVKVSMTGSHNRVVGIPGKTPQEAYREAKRTLVVGVRRGTEFAPCKPSAHYQLPLNTSCPGMCEYCYLATTLGKKPYIRVYVNIDEILAKANEYIKLMAPEQVIFEGAATSDPIPTEYLTGLLRKTVEFFGAQPTARFRFVTKFTDIGSLLDARHNRHTRFRFSINAGSIVAKHEHGTPGLEERAKAAAQAAAAGYPIGFIVAPIFNFPGWRQEYAILFQMLDNLMPAAARRDITFELITHRFTTRAKNNILAVFPKTQLPLEEEGRRFKYGQFGYGKYLYGKEVMDELKPMLTGQIVKHFPDAQIEYFV